ncbi:MAG: hypothetical protein KDC95_00780 [Planctomycetes bacterium]|nr:hypothetical protein [Planctomycetota bacterium]
MPRVSDRLRVPVWLVLCWTLAGCVTPSARYAQIRLGAGVLGDYVQAVSGHGVIEEVRTHDVGPTAALAVGTEFDSWSFELEAATRRHEHDELRTRGINGGVIDLEGQVTMHTLMANALFEIDTGTPLRPFVGLGIGTTYLDVQTRTYVPSERDLVLAAQGLLGLSWRYSEAVSLALTFRHLDNTVTSLRGGRRDFYDEYVSDSIELGLRVRF